MIPEAELGCSISLTSSRCYVKREQLNFSDVSLAFDLVDNEKAVVCLCECFWTASLALYGFNKQHRQTGVRSKAAEKKEERIGKQKVDTWIKRTFDFLKIITYSIY